MPSSSTLAPPAEPTVAPGHDLLPQYRAVRSLSERLCDTLVPEDYVVQSMPDVSPTKWHLAHTSWFFETFLLRPNLPNYCSLHPQYEFLFNSYYNSLGARHCRPKRGLISRPTVADTYAYRAYVDEHMEALLEGANEERLSRLTPLVAVGLHHEQQHQELMVTDIKHVFSENPLRPVYRDRRTEVPAEAPPLTWAEFPEQLAWIGHDGNGFAFDNEGPRHREFVPAFALASRLVTCGEYQTFMEDGGYARPEFWLSEGWATVQARGWQAPLYWERQDGRWWQFTLSGMRPVEEAEPVCHLSLFEADAYAHWAGRQWPGARLPTEFEWEVAARGLPWAGNFVEGGLFHPAAAPPAPPHALTQMFGDVWEWTRSQYSPYPGYAPPAGALGEYNGKFMCNQFVLRGGSCATSQTHIRDTYRNFFPPDARWQFMGLRLARDAAS
ncbi:MAG: ergothioneine biosynthesis protein EgtB [Armatimonadetes bacterium]|nr:ergothioneine biosynthesis protein EgtB [Armatimonadota bacterium]